MSARAVLYGLLMVVAAAAAVLSFAALRDLALTCGFAVSLAWLLPVVVDAGAASGSLVWLGGWAAEGARRFARTLALTLLALSVAANALGHGLAAYSLAPPWWVVVVVSAIAPAVLGAVVHLAVLVGRPATTAPSSVLMTQDEMALDEMGLDDAAGAFADGLLDEHGLSRAWEHAPAVAPSRRERASTLIAAGVGRRRLSRELDITEYEARQMLQRTRATTNGTTAGTDDPGSRSVNGAAVLSGAEVSS